MLNGLALFAGYGGLEIGLSEYVRTVCYVERELYPVAVIRSRIKEGKLDDAPIWDDVTTFDGTKWRGKVDIISGGFPCQDISVAGKGRGIKEGTRSGLWFEFLRIINEVRPAFVFVENVSALTHRGLDIVLGQLSEAGYDARWTDLRASDVGAPHRRERMFILAHSKQPRTIRQGESESLSEDRRDEIQPDRLQTAEEAHAGGNYNSRREADVADTKLCGYEGRIDVEGQERCEGVGESIIDGTLYKPSTDGEKENLADTSEQRPQNKTDKQKLEGEGRSELQFRESGDNGTEDMADTTKRKSGEQETRNWRKGSERGSSEHDWRQDPADLDPSSESFVGRVADGVANRVDRIKCLGNGVVPQQAERAWEILMGVQE